MSPPHVHRLVLMLSNAGIPPINTVGAPTFQGDTTTGIHGCGVNTPMAAVVAAATMGLLGVVHIPNGMMFFMGMKSMMLAAGCIPDSTRFSGVTTNIEGAIPKTQVNVARLTT
ncbi:hypothetical protein [Thermomonas sp.]|uniref:hypothetical protein n=1 Tax=Thermomonas sp. TaxID=1971895 RepID=UPI0032E3E7D0